MPLSVSKLQEQHIIKVPKIDLRIRTIPNARNKKRFRSRHEKRHIIKRRSNGTTTTSLMGASNDDDHVLRNVKKKSCGYCREPGHQKKRCPKVTCWVDPPVLGAEARSRLASNLKSKTYIVLKTAPDGCDKPVCRDFPKAGVSGLVLHRKIMVNDGDRSETCVSCTLLMEKGARTVSARSLPLQLILLPPFR
jgi:hypothetical protein